MTKSLIALALAATLLTANVSFAATSEQPPADDTTLTFQKTLFVHEGEYAKVFAETRKIAKGEVLWNILRDEYGMEASAIPALIESFREVNPGVDPNMLSIGQVIRVPFKVEADYQAPPPPMPAPEGSYAVRPGDNLWNILKDVYGVPEDEIDQTLKSVADANPGLKDINRLWVGQMLVIPVDPRVQEPVAKAQPPKPAPKPAPESAPDPEEEEKPGVPEYFTSVLDLIEAMGCEIEREGQTFIPVNRGRSIRLDAQEFPIIIGPSGKKVLLDPGSRLSSAMLGNMETSWGYATIQGVPQDAQQYLDSMITKLGFYEATRGSRAIALGGGAALNALTSWTVIPTSDDLWSGRVHLIFPKGSVVDPALAALARDKGYLLHLVATASADQGRPPAKLKSLTLTGGDDAVDGAATLLRMLGVDHKVRPEIICLADDGTTEKVNALLTFEYGGLKYAMPPASPAKAENSLLQAGYFTFTWPDKATALNRFTDLSALIGIDHRRTELEVPRNGALRLRTDGLVVKHERLKLELLPSEYGLRDDVAVFITEAALPPEASAMLAQEGYFPWIIQ